MIGYLLDDTVPVVMGGRREHIVRDPAPELLRGDPRVVARTIDALETKRRYRCATLSFARDDVDIEKWRRRDPEAVRRIDAAIELWRETAFAGIVPNARPPMIVSTHLHVGRLEVNLLVPSCVMVPTPMDRRVPRAYNPHPPLSASRALWTAYEDAVNGAFGWRDPRDPGNLSPVRGPSWLEKRAAALDRWIEARVDEEGDGTGDTPDPKPAAGLDQEDPRVRLLRATKSIARGGATSRDALLSGLDPTLTDLGWLVDEVRDDAFVLAPQDGVPPVSLMLHGALCEASPTPPCPVAIAAREQVLATAPDRLAAAWRMRAEDNLRLYGSSVARVDRSFDPRPILRVPATPILSAGLALCRIAKTLLDRIAGIAGRVAVRDALTGWAAQGGFADVRRAFADLAGTPPIVLRQATGSETQVLHVAADDDAPAP
ncbi:hypothetical protein JQC91_17805 [Jannaschia sp. Os4]|uniref:hypothetical protein n=1 Tax=Jannaschia sp. Os4 TaxID=2807617 RepID=UPI00193926B6|nr:hypothetical protein [Jannaschia sp. Os4]MBM2578166.1 hypothetical protein [Jannaschia sp. Os4]